MNKKSDAKIKADEKYEKKRAEKMHSFFARFNDDDWSEIEKAINKLGSKKEVLLRGAKLINESNS